MTRGELGYAVVTPAWNEADNLPPLARRLESQTQRPTAWVIVDAGSTDTTREVVDGLARKHAWIHSVSLEPGLAARGGPVVRGVMAGLAELGDELPEVVVKLDADLDFEDDYFERLVHAFASDPSLGIASGLCYEQVEGEWRPGFGTRSHVWGASRAYRRECLHEVLPLEERQGWDEIDAIKARLRGWEVGTLFDLPFRHLRPEGGRDGGRQRWFDQGDTARYMGYRFSYLVARALFRARRDPAALAMVPGYVGASLRRAPVLPDRDARAYVRRAQRLRELPLRAREARGKATH
jgi:glycosyltransferase involved in cell wall biosynthesis